MEWLQIVILIVMFGGLFFWQRRNMANKERRR